MIPKQHPIIPTVTVGDFYARHGEVLRMRPVGEERGYGRKILEPTINRPGLALAGFSRYFARKRVQVLGSAELSYLRNLPEPDLRRRCREVLGQRLPCLVIARNGVAPRIVLEEAARLNIAVFRTPMITMKFINAATIALELEFAPRTNEFGSMMEIHGIGTLIRGSSGVGKSECVLGLIERGYSLVSDDITCFQAIEGRYLVGSSPEVTRNHIEVRGLGIINVRAIFGITSIRLEKRLDLVVTLQEWNDGDELDRIGLDSETYDVLGISVPHVVIPVRIGRDLARLVEVAALDQKLKSYGQHSALELNQRLLALMAKKRHV